MKTRVKFIKRDYHTSMMRINKYLLKNGRQITKVTLTIKSNFINNKEDLIREVNEKVETKSVSNGEKIGTTKVKKTKKVGINGQEKNKMEY